MFRFVCTVEAVCRSPFDYVVLSRPGPIRRLRERKSMRVQTHFAVRFGVGETGDTYDGLGVAKSLSALGMSLMAPWTLVPSATGCAWLSGSDRRRWTQSYGPRL